MVGGEISELTNLSCATFHDTAMVKFITFWLNKKYFKVINFLFRGGGGGLDFFLKKPKQIKKKIFWEGGGGWKKYTYLSPCTYILQ